MRKLNTIMTPAAGAAAIAVGSSGVLGGPSSAAVFAGFVSVGIAGAMRGLSNPSGPRAPKPLTVARQHRRSSNPSVAEQRRRLERSLGLSDNDAYQARRSSADELAVTRYLNADLLDPTATLGFLMEMERDRSGGSTSESPSKGSDYVGKVKRPSPPPKPRRTAPRPQCRDCDVIYSVGQVDPVDYICSGECRTRSPFEKESDPHSAVYDIWNARQRCELPVSTVCPRHGRQVDRHCLSCARYAQIRAQARSRRQGA